MTSGNLGQIFLRTDSTPAEAARRVAAIPGFTIRTGSTADPVVTDFRIDPTIRLRGPWGPNYLANDPDEPDPTWQSAIDRYDTVWEAARTPRDDDRLTTDCLFACRVLSAATPWALLLVVDSDRLVAGRLQGGALTVFPPGTTPDVSHRPTWLPYRLGH